MRLFNLLVSFQSFHEKLGIRGDIWK